MNVPAMPVVAFSGTFSLLSIKSGLKKPFFQSSCARRLRQADGSTP
jgi:hypothetical protein